MSRKITTFRTVNVAPQPTCNYAVWIPSIFTSPVVVESATMPFGEIESKQIVIRGVSYSMPVKKKAQGAWSCTLGENILMTSLYQSLVKQNMDMSFNNIMNTLSTVKYNDIYIFITDGITGTAPICMTILKNCYLSKIEQIDLKASGATEAMNIKLTFQYNDIEDPIRFIEQNIDSSGTDYLTFAAIEAAVAAITTTAYSTIKLTEKTNDVVTNGVKNEIDEVKSNLSHTKGAINYRFDKLHNVLS